MQYQAELLCRVGEDKKTNDVLLLFFLCAQRRFRFAQSDQNLPLAEFGQSRMQSYFVQTT